VIQCSDSDSKSDCEGDNNGEDESEDKDDDAPPNFIDDDDCDSDNFAICASDP
jgi:hypothetical protein